MAAADISRRYSAGTFRPSVVVTRQVALAVPIHPHRMIAGLLVVLPGSRHSSLCQWPSRTARWRPAGTQPWATRSVAINFSGPGRALGFALRDLRCRRAQLAAADRADRRWPRSGRGRFMGHRSGLARNESSLSQGPRERWVGALKRPVPAGRTVDGRVREWLGPKSRCAGCEPATLDDRDVPECPPGPALSLRAVGVDEELAVDRVADVALERADCVLLGLPSANLRSK